MPLLIGRLLIMDSTVSEWRALDEAEGGKLATHHKNGALRQLKESSTDRLSSYLQLEEPRYARRCEKFSKIARKCEKMREMREDARNARKCEKVCEKCEKKSARICAMMREMREMREMFARACEKCEKMRDRARNSIENSREIRIAWFFLAGRD